MVNFKVAKIGTIIVAFGALLYSLFQLLAAGLLSGYDDTYDNVMLITSLVQVVASLVLIVFGFILKERNRIFTAVVSFLIAAGMIVAIVLSSASYIIFVFPLVLIVTGVLCILARQ